MRVNVIGGGPAGLYFALLMKRHDASHRVTVFERNPPDATFGWGVVFSGRTLSNLREADPASHRRITESFQTWDNVDVVFRDADAGLFAAHSYKFSPGTSTFIVECDEGTWARAGFQRMTDEETRAHLA